MKIPRLLHLLLSWLCPEALREDVLAEIEDAYERRRAGAGRTASMGFLLRQIFCPDWVRLHLQVHQRPRRPGRRAKEHDMNLLCQDIAYAFRSLRRHPGFTAVVVATLGLGIGANIAVISVVRAVLLRPLPYGGEERIVDLWSQWEAFPKTWVSIPEYRFYRDEIESFEEVALYYPGSIHLTDGEPERVGFAEVTVNLFEIFGVEAALGRTFTAEEADLPRAAAVLLSHGLWTRRYGSNPDLVGGTVELDGTSATVVGILPEGFQLPIDFGAETRTEIYAPVAVPPGTEPIPPMGGSHSYWASARLRDGYTIEEARAEVLAFNRRETTSGIYPESWRFRTLVIPVAEDVVGEVRVALAILSGAVGFVLLMACANVANVVLTRGQERRREIALRVSLGAGSGRLFRQLMTESLVLSGLGALAALAVAQGALQILLALEPGGIPRLGEARLDGAVLALALGLSFLTAVLFGFFPALSGARGAFVEGVRGAGSGIGPERFRFSLLVLQMALAVVLVAGAGLMIRTFANLISLHPGFRADGVLTMRFSTPSASYPDSTAMHSFWERVLGEVRALPGVEEAGAVRILPLATQIGDWGLKVEGYVLAPGENLAADWQVATPGYFEALGIPVLEGRGFREADRADAEPVIVVNQAFAERFWPQESALGRRVGIGGGDDSSWTRVVGVVGNVRHNGVTARMKPGWYLPFEQAHLSLDFTPGAMTLAVRSSGPIEALAPAVREVVRRIDPKLPLAEVRRLDEVLAAAVAPSRFTMALLSTLSLLALVLAAVGVYGVVSYSVSRRTPEIGIRMALGASRGSVVGLLAKRVGLAAFAGLAVGTAGALLAGSTMGAVLHGVRPSDPLTFAMVPLVLAATALLGSAVPAFRAARVDPAATLRSE